MTCKDCVHFSVCKKKHCIDFCINDDGELSMWNDVETDCENFKNNSHGVPFEIVETINKTIERLQEEKDALTKNYAECMKEYAREIFAEIEKLLECCFSSCHINGTEEQFDFYRADLGFQISELKKKYTEGQKDD